MRFSTSAILAILATPFALAQSNAFNNPVGFSATAGQSVKLSWNPTTSGTVTLVLRSGASSDLEAGTTIASNIQNSGSYTWAVPSSITRGSDYTVEIVSDTDSTEVNYTPYFVIDSTNTVATSTGDVSVGAPSSSLAMSTASNTNSGTTVAATVSATSTMSAFGSMTTSASGSGSSTMSGSSSSASGSSTSATGSSSGAGFQTSTSASASASAETGAAPRATAAAGLMGLIALGAMAL